jgi:hypothetical protein
MRSVDNFRVGDTVKRMSGNHIGLTGKVIATKPRIGIVVTHIRVSINFDLHEVHGMWRDIYNKYFRDRWTPVGGWRRIDG